MEAHQKRYATDDLFTEQYHVLGEICSSASVSVACPGRNSRCHLGSLHYMNYL